MVRWLAPVLAVVLVATSVGAAAGATAGTPGGARPTADRTVPPPLATQQEFDRTEFAITVYANGSARWEFTFTRTNLNETEQQQFEAFAREFNENSTELYTTFRDRARSLAAQGSNVTGREMTATNFDRRAGLSGLNNDQGVVEMSFTWTNFGATSGDRVTVGDVFQDGLYIGPDQRVVFHPGPGMAFRSANPSPDFLSNDSLADSRTIAWEGELSFFDQRPRVVFVPVTATETPTATPPTGNGTPGPGPGTTTSIGGGSDGGGGTGLLPWAALALVVVLGIGAAVAYRSGALGGDVSTGGGDGGSGGAGAGAAAGEAGAAVPDEELLSDEDRVMKLLEESGGRMKQVNIVDETGWSKSKVSMLLSEMEEAGEISKLRVGRENIISLKGEEPEAAGSPFDDEDAE